jgi:hypothetical protein
MAKGMDTFDARNHLDKNDPGMPQFLRKLKEHKGKKGKKKDPKEGSKADHKEDKMMNHLQDFVR